MRRLTLIFCALVAFAAVVAAEPVTYKDPTYKFEISYPSDWIRKDVEPDKDAMTGIEINSPDDAVSCTIYVNKLSAAKLAAVTAGSLLAGGDTSQAMFGEWTDSDWKDVFDFLTETKVLNHREIRMKDHELAVRAEVTGKYDATGKAVNMHILSANAYARKAVIANNCVIAAIGSTEEDWHRYAQTLDEIVSSFDVQSE
jgi:PsbP